MDRSNEYFHNQNPERSQPQSYDQIYLANSPNTQNSFPNYSATSHVYLPQSALDNQFHKPGVPNSLEINEPRPMSSSTQYIPSLIYGSTPNSIANNSNYIPANEQVLQPGKPPTLLSTGPLESKPELPTGRNRCGRKSNNIAKRKHESDLKKAIILVVLNDYSLRQAATATGVSHETLRRRLHNLKLRSEASKRNSGLNSHQTESKDDQSISVLAKETQITRSNVDNPVEFNDNQSTSATEIGSPTAFLHGPEIGYNNKQISKVISNMENFERIISKDATFETSGHQKRIFDEFSKVKSVMMNYIDHSIEALQTARVMILEEIEHNEYVNTNKSYLGNAGQGVNTKARLEAKDKVELTMQKGTYQPVSGVATSQSPSPTMAQSYQVPENIATVVAMAMPAQAAHMGPKFKRIGSIDSLINDSNIVNSDNQRRPYFSGLDEKLEMGDDGGQKTRAPNPTQPPSSPSIKRGSQVSIMSLLTDDD